MFDNSIVSYSALLRAEFMQKKCNKQSLHFQNPKIVLLKKMCSFDKLINFFLILIILAFFSLLSSSQEIKACRDGFKESPGCLLEVQNCIYLWSEGGFIKLNLQKDDKLKLIKIDLPANDTKSISATGSCPQASDVGNIVVTYTNLINVSKAVVTFTIKAVDKDYWSVQNLSIQLESKFFI